MIPGPRPPGGRPRLTARTGGAVLLAGLCALIVVGLTRADADPRPDAGLQGDRRPPTAELTRAGPPIVAPLAVEPDIQVAPNPQACTSTSLIGQVLEEPQFLVLTEPGSDTQVAWSVDGQAVGSSEVAPFLPLDAAGAPVPLVPDALPSGAHEVVAVVQERGETTRQLFGSFVTSASGMVPAEPAGIAVSPAGGAAAPLRSWAVLSGVVSFSATAAGAPVGLSLDGKELGPEPVDTAALAAGRHTVTASVPAADGSALALERTFVTTGGRPVPAACEAVDVRTYGAVGDGVADDTKAVVAAIDVAMATGATVLLPPGTYAVPRLKNVTLSREVSFAGADGAILDGARPGEKYTMFNVDASVSFSGVTVRNAGKLFSFDRLSRRIDRFIVRGSTFTDVYSPAHSSEPPAQLVDYIGIEDNDIQRAVKGIYLPLSLIGHAQVTGNIVADVGDAAIRLGSDVAESFASQRNIEVRKNDIRHVTGESDANGIKVMGVDSLIVDNDVADIASTDGTDSEGIYTKGYGHRIVGNRLHDAGRTQAQITVKSDSTVISDNTIITDVAETNAIRIEGSDVTVRDNHLQGGLPESIGISTKLTAGFGGYVFEGNSFSNTDGIAISTGGDGPVIIRNNEFSGVRGRSAVEVRASQADTDDVQVLDNVVQAMSAPDSRAFLLGARSGHAMTGVRIVDNRVTDAASAVAFDLDAKAHVRDVVVTGNEWISLRGSALSGEERLDGFTYEG